MGFCINLRCLLVLLAYGTEAVSLASRCVDAWYSSRMDRRLHSGAGALLFAAHMFIVSTVASRIKASMFEARFCTGAHLRLLVHFAECTRFLGFLTRGSDMQSGDPGPIPLAKVENLAWMLRLCQPLKVPAATSQRTGPTQQTPSAT